MAAQIKPLLEKNVFKRYLKKKYNNQFLGNCYKQFIFTIVIKCFAK